MSYTETGYDGDGFLWTSNLVHSCFHCTGHWETYIFQS